MKKIVKLCIKYGNLIVGGRDMFKMLKNQKGMTLVELLAVMVIVGIIAAISIPAIGGLLENTRKDAFIANAVSLQEAARLYQANNEGVTTITWNNETKKWSPEDFAGYLENFKDSTNSNGDFTEAEVTIATGANGVVSYKTKLVGGKYSLGAAVDLLKDAKEYTRASVGVKPAPSN